MRDTSGAYPLLKIFINPQTAEAVEKSVVMNISSQITYGLTRVNIHPENTQMRTAEWVGSFSNSRDRPLMRANLSSASWDQQKNQVPLEGAQNLSQQSNVSELQSQSTEVVQESSTDTLYQSFQPNAEAPQDIIFSPLNPVSVKETEDLRILTHNDVKTLDTSRMSNLKEKNELLFSKVIKAINDCCCFTT